MRRERGRPARATLAVRTHWLEVCRNEAAPVTGSAQEPMAVVHDVRDWPAPGRRTADGGPPVAADDGA